MELHIAGSDATEGLGAELSATAARLSHPATEERLRQEADVLDLQAAASEADFERHYEMLVRTRCDIDPASFSLPQGVGTVAGIKDKLKNALLKNGLNLLARWIAQRQNTVNSQLAYEIEFERRTRAREVAELKERLAKLEEK